MVSGGNRGRPPTPGPRDESGKLEQNQGESRGAAIWHWLKAYGASMGLDARLSSQLGRLSYCGDLTDTQVDAGMLIGRIYGEYERYRGARRSAASPSYERAYGRSDDPIDPIELGKLERRIRRAERRWLSLQEAIEALPANTRRAREVLEALCVEDRPIARADLPSVAAALTRIARMFHVTPPGEAPARSAVAIMNSRPARRRPKDPRAHPGSPRREQRARRGNPEREAWLEVARQLRPAATDGELEAAWTDFGSRRDFRRAVVDREQVRSEKGRRRAR